MILIASWPCCFKNSLITMLLRFLFPRSSRLHIQENLVWAFENLGKKYDCSNLLLDNLLVGLAVIPVPNKFLIVG